MEPYLLNVHGRERGVLYQYRTAHIPRGPFLSVTNDIPHLKYEQSIGFSRISIDKTGTRIVAGDFQGSIYLFDTQENKFWFVCHLDRCSTAIAFTPYRGKDVIVGSSDCSLSFVDSEACRVLKTVCLHNTCVSHISLNHNDKSALTSSLECVCMWDLSNFNLLHKLSVKKSIDILRGFFLPTRDVLVVAFKDNSVFMWNSISLKCVSNFVCGSRKPSWLRTVDGTKDGALLVCAGKTDWISIWSVRSNCFLYNMSLSDFLVSVRHLMCLSGWFNNNYHLVSVISREGKLQFFDVDAAEGLGVVEDETWRVLFATESNGKLAVITSLSSFKVYDLKTVFLEGRRGFLEKHVIAEKIPFLKARKRQLRKKTKKEFEIQQLMSILYGSGEYPNKYRPFIWSQLLKLPRNEEFVMYYESKIIYSFNKFAIENAILRKCFQRMLSMLIRWSPFLKEVDYIPFMVFPFVKLLHQNMQLCFELLVMVINCWCQNWFFYLPFSPFNILCAVENLLLYHDRPLLHHFLLNDISPEIYAFSLMTTSFSDVFSRDEWVKLWDNIFSNPPSYIIFIVIAYNIVARDVLLECENEEEFKVFFSRRSLLAINVIQEAYNLQKKTPACFDPTPIFGTFHAIPKGGYPVFQRFSTVDIELNMLTRQRFLDSEVDYFQKRRERLQQEILFEAPENERTAAGREIQKENLLELKELMKLQREYVLKYSREKPVEVLDVIDRKLRKIQELVHKRLIEQTLIFEYEFRQSEIEERTEEIAKTRSGKRQALVPEEKPDEHFGAEHMSEDISSSERIVDDVLFLREYLARGSATE